MKFLFKLTKVQLTTLEAVDDFRGDPAANDLVDPLGIKESAARSRMLKLESMGILESHLGTCPHYGGRAYRAWQVTSEGTDFLIQLEQAHDFWRSLQHITFDGREIGLFNDEGLLEGEIYTEAQLRERVADYNAEDLSHAGVVCPQCRSAEKDYCDCED